MTAVIFKFQKPDGEPVVGASFTVTLRKPTFDETSDDGILLPGVIEGITDAQGMCTLELAPGYGLYYLSMATPGAVEDVEGCMPGLHYKFVVPEGLVTARVETLIVTTPTWSQPWDEQALAIITEAKASALSSAVRAETAAQTIEGDAARAEAAAVIAVDSKNAAGASADTAGLLAEQARVSAVNSGNSANAASSSATAALNSENAAEQYAIDASVAGAQAGAVAGTNAANAVVDTKVDKVAGKGLSTNDYDATEKAKVAEAIPSSQKGAASGVATLGADGKLPVSQLPPLAINEVFTVATQAAMLALTAERGDGAIRTDQNGQWYILTTDAPSVLANWKPINQNLGVALTALGALTPAADTIAYFSGPATAATAAFTAKARALLARTDTAGMQAELGLVPVTSNIDATAGRLVTPGWMGLGTVSGTLLSNANVELPSGKYYTSADWTGSPFAGTSSLNRGYLDVSSWGQTGYQCQEFTPLFVAAGNPKMFRTNVGGVWRAWEPVLGASSVGTAAYLTVTTSYTDSTLGRAIKVGDFGIGNTAVPLVTDFNADIKPGWYCGYGDSHAAASIAAPPGSGGGAISILAMQGLNSANYKTFLAGSLGGSGSQDLFIGSRWSGTSTAPAWRRVITDGNATLDPALNTGGIVFSGSNANGSFTKFADGTLIQRGSGSETTTTVSASVYGTTAGNMTVLNKTIGLPVAFYSTDFHAQCVATDRGATNLASSKTTTSFFTQLQHNGAIAVPYTWIAIGRWKA